MHLVLVHEVEQVLVRLILCRARPTKVLGVHLQGPGPPAQVCHVSCAQIARHRRRFFMSFTTRTIFACLDRSFVHAMQFGEDPLVDVVGIVHERALAVTDLCFQVNLLSEEVGLDRDVEREAV